LDSRPTGGAAEADRSLGITTRLLDVAGPSVRHHACDSRRIVFLGRSESLIDAVRHITGVFLEFPDTRLTLEDAARLTGLEPMRCDAVMKALEQAGLIYRQSDGGYIRRQTRSKRGPVAGRGGDGRNDGDGPTRPPLPRAAEKLPPREVSSGIMACPICGLTLRATRRITPRLPLGDGKRNVSPRLLTWTCDTCGLHYHREPVA
jgi:hypothetical protein